MTFDITKYLDIFEEDLAIKSRFNPKEPIYGEENRRDIARIRSFLATSLSEAYKLGIEKGIEQAIELSDKIESQASHTEFNEWRAFKGIRNALRDFLTKSNE